jgi:uncharacterized membrane protein
MQAAVTPAGARTSAATRIQSVDLIRGAVMIVMALDHIREFFNRDAFLFNPEDLSRTTAALFFTRWITHFCAPVFVFFAGVSVYLASAKRPDRAAVSRHLVARGLWLILLEFTVLEVAWTFNFHYEAVLIQVIWTIGWSMIFLAALIWLPRRVVAALALAVIALHNLFDAVMPARFGSHAWIWNLLHVPGAVPVGHTMVFMLYPLIPWAAVLAAGWCFAPVLRIEDADRRRRILVRTGAALTAGFVAVRALDVYGDPLHWKWHSSAIVTLMDFLRVNKYPPSLDFLLMTLGPAILAMGLINGIRVSENNPLRVFGRVPMFYYIAHIYTFHAVAVLFAQLRYGHSGFFLHFPGLNRPPDWPKDYGYSLAETYLIWIGIVTLLYFPCRWWMHVKQRKRSWWLSYL